MINIAVVEDSVKDAELLTEYINRAFLSTSETCSVTCFSNPVLFLEGYRGNYEIVFMDIELPDINGMETAKRLREADANVILIFVTNMAQFAVGGYAVDAMDFMVKPVSYDNLRLKIARALKRIDSRKAEKFVINGKTGAKIVLINQIRYIEIMDHKITIHLTDGEVVLSGSLSKLEEKLAGFAFSRCNKCYLVNLNYVTGVDGFTVFVGKEQLAISRSRKKPFLKDIADYLGGSV